MEEKIEKPSIEKCREAINEICKGLNFSEQELQHRARFLFLMQRLSFWDEMPVLFDECNYQRGLGVKKIANIGEAPEAIVFAYGYGGAGGADLYEALAKEEKIPTLKAEFFDKFGEASFRGYPLEQCQCIWEFFEPYLHKIKY